MLESDGDLPKTSRGNKKAVCSKSSADTYIWSPIATGAIGFFLRFPLLTSELSKNKLRHTKTVKSLFEQRLIRIRQHQARCGQKHSTDRSQLEDLCRENVEAGKVNHLIGYSLKLGWLFGIGCP